MGVPASFSLERINLDSFGFSNTPNGAEDDVIFHFDISFQEHIKVDSKIITMTFLANIYLDENKDNRVGAFQTSLDYLINNFEEVFAEKEIPDYLIEHLLSISISTSRGILYAQTKGTYLDKFLLPILNPKEIIEKLNQDNPERLVANGNNYIHLGNLVKAVEYYKKVLELEPNNIEALYNICSAYNLLLNYEGVIEIATKLLSFDNLRQSVLHTIHVWRGAAFLKVGRYDEAINDFTIALKIRVTPEVYNVRADGYKSLKNYENAIKDAEAALNLDSHFGLAHATLAEIYSEIGDDKLFYKSIENAFINRFNIKEYIHHPAYSKYLTDKKFLNLLKIYHQTIDVKLI